MLGKQDDDTSDEHEDTQADKRGTDSKDRDGSRVFVSQSPCRELSLPERRFKVIRLPQTEWPRRGAWRR